jgi:hypothetical protein
MFFMAGSLGRGDTGAAQLRLRPEFLLVNKDRKIRNKFVSAGMLARN